MTDKNKKDGKKPAEQVKPNGGERSGGTPPASQGPKPEGAQKPPVTPKPVVAGFSLENLMTVYTKKRGLLQKQHDALRGRATRYEATIEKLNGEVAKITAKLATIIVPSFVDVFVKPIAAELHKHFPKSVMAISGGGMAEAVTITFSEPDATADDRLTGRKAKSVTVLPVADGIAVRDYGRDLKQFQPGSLGYASGLNHPLVPMPKTADIKWLVQWVK